MADLKTSAPPGNLDVSTFELGTGTTLIEASAGTGKTFTIQYIVLDLLLKGLSLQEILVVTFTEAATQELVDRLQSFLSKTDQILNGSQGGDAATHAVLQRAKERFGEGEVRRRIRKAMLEMDQASIHTIHGFCMRALQENAFAADASFDLELTTDLGPIVGELVMDFLRKVHLCLPIPPPKAANLHNLKSRAFKLTDMLEIEQPFEGDLSKLGADLEQAAKGVSSFEKDKDAIVREFMGFQNQLKGNIYKAGFFEKFEALLTRLLANPLSVSQKDLEKLTASKIGASFKSKYSGTVLESGFYAACEALHEVQEKYTPSFERCFDTWFIESFQQLKQEHGIFTYSDMINNLDLALRRSKRLREQLRRRYRAALVDEFQDTDARQYSIFKTLFGDGRTQGRYLAMIGDPKQSIYAFRGADINAYLKAREDADYRYTLPVNYRSVAKMVDGTNRFFKNTNLSPAEAEEAESIPFAPVDAKDEPEERLCFAEGFEAEHLFERALPFAGDDTIKSAQSKCAYLMAADVKCLLDLSDAGYVFFESKLESGPVRRRVHAGDIAVLVETHDEAAEAERALQEEGVIAVRAKTGNIWETREAEDFIYFLMASLKPTGDLINLLLVRPLYGKNDADLRSISDNELRAIYESFTVMGKLWREGASVSVIWTQFMDAYLLRERLLCQMGGERKLTNYLHVVEFAQALERVERLSPERLIDRLLEIMRNGVDSPSEEAHLVRLESDGRAVKIMTMHGSKGLEFPIVFLPGLWQKCIRKTAKDKAFVQTAVDNPDCFVGFETDADKVVRTQRAENIRLGYVAMTRAVHFCVYYNARSIPKPHRNTNHATGWFDQWLFEQRGDTYSGDIHEGFLDGITEYKPVVIDPIDKAPFIHGRTLNRDISHAYRITSYSAIAHAEQAPSDRDAETSVSPGTDESESQSREQRGDLAQPTVDPDLFLESFPGGVLTGTCIHEILERCDFTQPGHWAALVKSVVVRHFPDGAEVMLQKRMEDVLAMLEALCADPRPGFNGVSINLSALKPEACIPELEFYFPVSQVDLPALEDVLTKWGRRVGLDYEPAHLGSGLIEGFLTGSVDLFFVQGGRYTILDWKTNKPLESHRPLKCDYNREGMHAHMQHGRYYLQALIYSVATTAYLRQRLGARFDWDKHIGGFIYCFVRGLGKETGWLHECFTEEDVFAAGRALGLPQVTQPRS